MAKQKFTLVAALTMAALMGVASAQTGRDYLTIAGSYTVSPLATAVAERLAQAAKLKKAPDIQAISTDVGFKQFCVGDGIETLDIALSTRRIKASEAEACMKNGVKEMIELKIGHTAIVVARQGEIEDFRRLTRKDLFLAMAKDVPETEGGAKLIPNPYKTWKEINANLPNTKIQIWGPSSTYAIQSTVINEIMVEGCKQISTLKALEASDPNAFDAVCRSFRKDAAYNEYKDHNALIQEMRNNPNTLGIFPDTFLHNSGLTSLPIDGVEPLPGSIAHNLYPLTRPLFLYVKKSHVDLVVGLRDYLAESTSDDAISTTGYLLSAGLVPIPLPERRQAQADAKDLKSLVLKPELAQTPF